MFNGDWGRVCNNYWGDNEAGVLCRQLGYIDGVVNKSYTGRGPGHVWMNYLRCDGHEKSLLHCRFYWNPSDAGCDDVGVICFDTGKS